MKKKIAIIGCGNIGYRHLQSLLKIINLIELWVVEKSQKKKNKINDKDDILFKAGLFKMTNIFLSGKKSQLPKIKEHTLNIQNFYRPFVKNKSL